MESTTVAGQIAEYRARIAERDSVEGKPYLSFYFAVALVIITLTGFAILKGRNGLVGRGGILFVTGVLFPLLFLLLG